MLSNLVFVFRRRWPILVFIPLAAVALVVMLAPAPQKASIRYTSTVFLAADPDVVNAVELEQASVDIRQAAVATRAGEKLGLEGVPPNRLAKHVKTNTKEQSLTIVLTSEEEDPKKAEKYTKAFAEAFLEIDQSNRNGEFEDQLKELESSRDKAQFALTDYLNQNAAKLNAVPPDAGALAGQQVLRDRVSAAEQRVSDLKDQQVRSPFRIAGATPATRVEAVKLQLPQSRGVRAAVTLFIAALGAVFLVALIERFNPRIDNPKDAETIIGAPVLGMIPIMKGKRHTIVERADLSLFSGPFAESFRAIRAHLDFRSAADELGRPPCVMVVSSAPGEGKTTTAAFLALSYEELGRDAVVVGGDFRRPAIHRLFGVPRAPGLSSRLLANQGPERTEEVVRSIVKRDELTGVRVIPSGPGTDRVTGLLGDLAAVTSAGLESGCTVVIDTAPVMVANDAIDFLPFVDWVVVVVRLGRTTERSLRQTMASLELNNARVAGCAMMGSLESSDAKRYYYSYYRVEEDPNMPPPTPGSKVGKTRRSDPAATDAALDQAASGSNATKATPPAAPEAPEQA